MANLSLNCEHTVYLTAKSAKGYLKNLNDSIFGCIIHINELYTLAATTVQKSPFTVYLNRP